MAGLALEPIVEKAESRSNRTTLLVGALVVAALSILFFSTYFNRFAGLRSGNGGFSAGSSWLEGVLPYRDYFCTAPPVNIVSAAAVLRVFGERLVVLRTFAVFERTMMAVVLYFWLSRFVRASHAAMAAFVAIVVCSGDISDPFYSYSHDTVFLAELSGFIASFALDARSKRAWMFAGLSGVVAGLCFCTKQTIGSGTVVAIPVICAMFLFRLDGFRKARDFVTWYTAGCVLPVAVLFIWLAKLGIAKAYLLQTFVTGPAAKGLGGNQFLIRTAQVATLMWPFLTLGVLACVLSWRTIRRSGEREESRPTDSPMRLVAILAIAGLAVTAGVAASYTGMTLIPALPRSSIYFVFLTCPLLGLRYGWLFLRKTVSRRESQYCLLAAISFVTASMLSLSWPAYEQMVMPGLGFLIAVVLDGSRRWCPWILCGICPIILVQQTCAKLNLPEGFEGWFEPPVREATMRSSLPEMSGLLLPPGIVRVIDGTAKIISENTKPGDKIFTYPEMTLFYTITGRMWPTLAGSHNIDVVNDSLATEEAGRLLRNPPKVIVYYREPEEHLREEEINWRRGRRAGQRDIIAAIETLIKDYRLAGSFEGPQNARTVLVYVRP